MTTWPGASYAGVLDAECLAAGMRAEADGSAGAVACRSVLEERRVGEALAAGVACVEREAGCPPCPEAAAGDAPSSWWPAVAGAAGALIGFVVGLLI